MSKDELTKWLANNPTHDQFNDALDTMDAFELQDAYNWDILSA
ncbi:hypothetical protein Xoosp13_4 [Xanthomonas phage Xoo-sp13]|nr:hypothetical protein Xoosp13_4 [Xanthomonas phage Xoo-sp13]